MPENDKREIVAACLRDRHTSADAILNALHQGGWQVTPRDAEARGLRADWGVSEDEPER